MADYVANLRPLHSDIHAFATSPDLCRRLALNRGVQAHYLAFDRDPVATIAAAENCLSEKRLVKSGDHLVILADILAGKDRFDSIQLRIVP
jgi:pyruvate kinase